MSDYSSFFAQLDAITFLLFVLSVLGIFFVILILFLINTSYQKVDDDKFVIHFRNGRIKQIRKGGSILVLPILDEIIFLPATKHVTSAMARDDIRSNDDKTLNVKIAINWRVTDPLTAFNHFSWIKDDPNYVEKLLTSIAQSAVRKYCFKQASNRIQDQKNELETFIFDKLIEFVGDSGLEIMKIVVSEIKIIS